MKKIISFLLIYSFIVGMMPSSTTAVDGIGNVSEDTVVSMEKIDNAVPCFGDYEFSEDSGEYSTMSTGIEDQYEDNNSTKYATRIISPPTGEPQDVYSIISATLHKGTWFFDLIEKSADEDYYYFDLFGEANVTINLTNIPSGYDYELKLFMHVNGIDVSESDISQVAASVRGGNASEAINKTLQPGRYYIWVYAHNEECNDSAYYKLSANVEYTAKDVSINYLRYNKGAKAAVWLSDYDPCGISSFNTFSKVRVGFRMTDSSTGEEINYFGNPYPIYYAGFTKPFYVEHATLYIWDVSLRNEVRNALIEYKDELTLLLSEYEDDQEVQILANTAADVILYSVFLAISIYLAPEAILPAMTLEAANVVSTPLVHGVISMFFPSEETIVTKGELLHYIEKLIVALNTSTGSNNLQVVKISSRYMYTSEQYYLPIHSYYYFDYAPISEEIDFLYGDDLIKAYQSYVVNENSENSCDVKSVAYGTVYGIRDMDDFEKVFSRTDYTLSDSNTITYSNVTLNNSISSSIEVDEYQWYEFTAPSDGAYRFYSQGDLDVIGELFYGVVPDDVTFGRIYYSDDEVTDDGNDPDCNFYFVKQMEAGEKVYIRVSTWENGTYTLKVSNS